MLVGGTLLAGEITEKLVQTFLKDNSDRWKKLLFEYLNKASDAYKGAELIFTGEVFIDESSGYIHKVTLKNHYGLLDKPNIALASVRLDLEDSTELTDQTIRIGSLTSDKTTNNTQRSDVALYAPGPVAAIDEKIQTVVLTEFFELNDSRYNRGKQRKDRKSTLNGCVYVEGDSKLNFSGSVLTFEKCPDR